MSRHDPKVTLLQIADYARKAIDLCSRNTLPEILADWKNCLALERALEVLGEAVKRLPEELRNRNPAIPWKLMAGMRDRVSHGYDSIDYETLWDTVRQDIPPLLAVVEGMLRELETD